jgi:hypothetical protein
MNCLKGSFRSPEVVKNERMNPYEDALAALI